MLHENINEKVNFKGIVEMKIKRSFVTNSSSTSFILTFEANEKMKDEFINKVNSLFNDYIEKNDFKDDFQEPPLLTNDNVEEIDPGVFVIKDFTPIYCGEHHKPQYIKDMFNKDSRMYELLIENGIIPLWAEPRDNNK